MATSSGALPVNQLAFPGAHSKIDRNIATEVNKAEPEYWINHKKHNFIHNMKLEQSSLASSRGKPPAEQRSNYNILHNKSDYIVL